MESLAYAQHINAPQHVLAWIETTLRKHLERHEETIQGVEHTIDFLCSDIAPKRLTRATFSQMYKRAEAWNATLQKKGHGIEEKPEDVETVLDFKDGFRVVKLIGKAAFEREGFLMRHCAGSYFGKNTEVYSLRDAKNEPHCTMEKDQQVKGKGNGDIHPKYIDYVVQFLEWSGMDVRDSEMAHLGYEVVPFGKYATTKLYRDRYARKGTEIKYKDGVRFFDVKTELKNYQGTDIALYRGDLVIEQRENFVSKALAEVGGSVYVREGATFTAPKLAKSGYVYVSKGATFTAPNYIGNVIRG